MEEQKSQWPELVGMDVDRAVEQIKLDNNNVNVIKVPSGSMVTMDYRMDRVRVYYNDSNIVEITPNIG